MWALDNRTAYAAERNWVRDKNGEHLWLVAVRAAFDIAADGKLSLADDQAPPVLVPVYYGDPGASSLRMDSDLLAVKPCTDVLLDACAHAPGAKAVGTVPVSIRVGEITKRLLVYGDRVYYKSAVGGLTTTPPQPFVSRQIRYEFAYGGRDVGAEGGTPGFDPRNPIGVGFSRDPDRLVHMPAPAVEYPNAEVSSVGPAGFGPIDAAWAPRLARAGTYDARWASTRKPLLAEDYDELYASAAPDDQRCARLRGGERVELANLTPEGLLVFELPKIYLTFATYFGDRREEHRARLVTVWIETESRRVHLIWQTSLRVAPRDDEYLDCTRIDEKPYLT